MTIEADAPAFEGTAPAKLNLTLAVGPRGADGFHPVESIFVRLGLSDRLAVAASGPDSDALDADRLTVAGPEPCPLSGNLVLAACRALRAAVDRPLPRLDMRLWKEIPVAAGLGGGSSDAAAALRLADRAWSLGLGAGTLAELGATLGSDVPFFLADTAAALVAGRGERVTPLPGALGTPGVLLWVPGRRLATRDVYAAFDASAMPSGDARAATMRLARIARQRGALLSGDETGRLVAELRDANDLWPAATVLDPGLGEVRRRIEERLDRPALLSGSGPALFTLYPSSEAAAAAARSTDLPGVGVIATALG